MRYVELRRHTDNDGDAMTAAPLAEIARHARDTPRAGLFPALSAPGG